PEADAERSQARAFFLGETLDLACHLIARQDAEIFDQPEGDPLAHAGKAFGLFELDQRLENGGDMAAQKLLEPCLDRVALAAEEVFGCANLDARLEQAIARLEPGDRRSLPHDVALPRQAQIGV